MAGWRGGGARCSNTDELVMLALPPSLTYKYRTLPHPRLTHIVTPATQLSSIRQIHVNNAGRLEPRDESCLHDNDAETGPKKLSMLLKTPSKS